MTTRQKHGILESISARIISKINSTEAQLLYILAASIAAILPSVIFEYLNLLETIPSSRCEAKSFFADVIASPVIETIMFIYAPYKVAFTLKLNPSPYLIAGAIIFALLHIIDGIAGVINAAFGGLILAFTFYCNFKKSLKKALILVIATHVSINVLANLANCAIHS